MTNPKLEQAKETLQKWTPGASSRRVADAICTVLAALAEAEKRHGSVTRQCACPGCRRMIPACWVSVLCFTCGSEDCDHTAKEKPPPHPLRRPRPR